MTHNRIAKKKIATSVLQKFVGFPISAVRLKTTRWRISSLVRNSTFRRRIQTQSTRSVQTARTPDCDCGASGSGTKIIFRCRFSIRLGKAPGKLLVSLDPNSPFFHEFFFLLRARVPCPHIIIILLSIINSFMHPLCWETGSPTKE